MPDQYVYEPWKAPIEVQHACGCVIGRDYPKPMCDADAAAEANLRRMDECRPPPTIGKPSSHLRRQRRLPRNEGSTSGWGGGEHAFHAADLRAATDDADQDGAAAAAAAHSPSHC